MSVRCSKGTAKEIIMMDDGHLAAEAVVLVEMVLLQLGKCIKLIEKVVLVKLLGCPCCRGKPLGLILKRGRLKLIVANSPFLF